MEAYPSRSQGIISNLLFDIKNNFTKTHLKIRKSYLCWSKENVAQDGLIILTILNVLPSTWSRQLMEESHNSFRAWVQS